MSHYFIGIDVGTGSTRAGIFDTNGSCLAVSKKDIQMWTYHADYVEQSSEDIWSCICHCVRDAMKQADLSPEQIGGIGFDATCSLVVLDKDAQPLAVNQEGNKERNIIVWMDHRAIVEAEVINAFPDEEVLRYVGGRISPEMQMPKLLWLKKHLPATWAQAAHFFDLPDYLTFRATGIPTRSLCSTVCKWTYMGHITQENELGWDRAFFDKIGLGELANHHFAKIGNDIQPMGQSLGNGLSERSAYELGLVAGIPVGVSVIDAHAGGIGMLGMQLNQEEIDFDRRLALIGGTSSCHMAVSSVARFTEGIWGPYYSAMVPEFWLTEGGQSATGALIDHILFHHGASAELERLAKEQQLSSYEYINTRLQELAGEKELALLTHNLHVCPYFHGNRSPRANPHLMGMISGLKLSSTVNDLALLYLATIQAIAYGTRHIIEAMNASGYQIETIVVCGGGIKNPVFLQQHADITGCTLIIPAEEEAVLLGSAMLGAVAGKQYSTITKAMSAMSHPGKHITPNPKLKPYHDNKYKVFHELYHNQIRYQELMEA